MTFKSVFNKYHKKVEEILRKPKLTVKEFAGLAYYKDCEEKVQPYVTEPTGEGFVMRSAEDLAPVNVSYKGFTKKGTVNETR